VNVLRTVGRVYVVVGAFGIIFGTLLNLALPSEVPKAGVVVRLELLANILAAIVMLIPARRAIASPYYGLVFGVQVLIVFWFSYWAVYFASSGFSSFQQFGLALPLPGLLSVGPSVVAFALLVHERGRARTVPICG